MASSHSRFNTTLPASTLPSAKLLFFRVPIAPQLLNSVDPFISLWFDLLLFFFRLYSFIFWERGKEGERQGEKHWCAGETSIGCLSHTPSWGPGLHPRCVPWLGTEPVTFWFTGWHAIHWATPARALPIFIHYTWVWSQLFPCLHPS